MARNETKQTTKSLECARYIVSLGSRMLHHTRDTRIANGILVYWRVNAARLPRKQQNIPRWELLPRPILGNLLSGASYPERPPQGRGGEGWAARGRHDIARWGLRLKIPVPAHAFAYIAFPPANVIEH